jgi:hypothetical protein
VFYDKNQKLLNDDDIARDLTAYYELLARQAECGKTGHETYRYVPKHKESEGALMLMIKVDNDVCPLCGADLTKGATHG